MINININNKVDKMENTKTKYKLAYKDYMEIYDMKEKNICKKYSKIQIAHALTQLAMELHDAECKIANEA